MDKVEENVILIGGVGINGAARDAEPESVYIKDKRGPNNDNTATVTNGVGSNNDQGNPNVFEKSGWGTNTQPIAFEFENNFLAGARLIALKNAKAKNNMLMGLVHLEGGPIGTKQEAQFTDNTITNGDGSACLRMKTGGKNGIRDNVIYGCRSVALGFGQTGMGEGVASHMTILDSPVGVHYWVGGPNARSHDMRKPEFELKQSKIYAMADGSGTGLRNPSVHAVQLGEPVAPDWWHVGGKASPLGHSSVSLYFKSAISDVSFVGYNNKQKGGVAIALGEGHAGSTSDSDYHPMMFSGIKFESTPVENYFRFQPPRGAGFGLKNCLQIDCDGLRNFLVIDQDGSILGQPGTVIPKPQKFYDKLGYVDPLGFDTMEDFIPFPARYDRSGDAIPFPSGVNHGTGGGLEFECNLDAGCTPVYQSKGYWLPEATLTFAKGTRIVAIREDGGLIKLDPIHHGWAYALYWVKTPECKKTMDPADSPKPESQHARRYGRVAAGQFGAHRNTSRVTATKGPVYTEPGIYRKGCTYVAEWSAYKCAGGKHRHLLIEVMDWNHQSRRWAPVSVEVNDNYAQQGGTMNILTGPAMYWPGSRLQTFHALGHVGLRHNIYFSADPPQHLRLHLQYADPADGVVACVYYGIPNNLIAYVGGTRKEPPASWVPTWDNLVFKKLTPDMAHGTNYYDRIGAETGRPGYLYAVVRGSQHVDFKISHKVVLTSKIKVDTNWGGWKDKNGSNFYKQGIDGLVRNIALLIGCPPTRVKILGNGTATKGTFWNSDTTSDDFAKWMWDQNQSMDRMTMDQWLTAPGAKLPNSSAGNSSAGNGTFLMQFAEHRHDAIRSVLTKFEEDRSYHHISLLTATEQAAVMERMALQDLGTAGDIQNRNLQNLQQAAEDRRTIVPAMVQKMEQDGEMYISSEVDEDEATKPAPSQATCNQNADDCAANDLDKWNKDENVIRQEGSMITAVCQTDGNGKGCTLGSSSSGGSTLLQLDTPGITSTSIIQAKVDNVPTKDNPRGWTCDTSKYGNGICDCECGVWDPDCDAVVASGSVNRLSVGALSNGSAAALTIVDSKHLRGVMSFIDSVNYNGIIDESEPSKIDELGISALHGLASRILQAQDGGDQAMKKRTFAKGDFAHMEAVPSDSCNYLPEPYPGMATYTPVCVKDDLWKPTLGEPRGRCGLLPDMKIGSQCKVPGDGSPISFMKTAGTNASAPKSVCGKMLDIFPTGGTGGIFSAGVGTTTAKYYNAGGTFMPGTGSTTPGLYERLQVDFSKDGKGMDTLFTKGFTLYAKVTLMPQQHCNGKRLFCIGEHNHWHHQGIEAYTDQCDGTTGRIQFVIRGRGRNIHLTVSDAIDAGSEMELMFVYKAADKDSKDEGALQIFKNGIKIAEDTRRGVGTAFKGKFNKMMFGDECQGSRHARNVIDGDIKDIRMWDEPVSWQKAVDGNPPDSSTSKDAKQKDKQAEVEVKCIHSKLNSWDFVCGDELPPDIGERFGYGSLDDKKASESFASSLARGLVSSCSDKISAKAVMYQGHFGDGLTAEYFRYRGNCHAPPFVFGLMPNLVRVDTEPKLPNTVKFHAPFNQYVVRWTGKLLIDAAGSYNFKVRVDDKAWVSIDGKLRIDQPSCGNGQKTIRGKDFTIKLEKGAHDISILYQNVGPSGDATPGTFDIKYKGLDTQGQLVPLPQDKLGSAPLRLAKLSQELSNSQNASKAGDVIPGAFEYDSNNHVGVMPKGSCNMDCRQGKLKEQGAYFKFFCPTTVTGHFIAKVNVGAQRAMMWIDGSADSTVWEMAPKSGSSTLLQKEATSRFNTLTEEEATYDESISASLGIDGFKFHKSQGQMHMSAPSPDVSVGSGEHTLILQGRPEADETFALAELRLGGGFTECQFFLQGKDKSTNDCN
jgi:hypothetical protein